ncbi:hypothetical protein TEA_003821 [Camellia sinensis var. sinensis]|uniref:Uncharacterized protein n=1 Tax=Camellia sinensis var. sinensis TaxID=542762 RepID=A0A4V6RYR1_CAMSN|nr:hypothetical protein TEA_003821 [Camellia sinensis var. sinensis]
MSAGGFLRNGRKNYTSIHSLLNRHSIADSIGSQRQQSKAYARFHNSRKTRELELSRPSILFSSPYCSSSTAVSSSFKSGFVGWYLGLIKSHPILTKSITSACIYTAADFSSQNFHQTIARPSSEPYDFVRTLRMAGYGMIIMGPSLHFWFNFVSKVLPKRDLITTLKKLVMGQTLYGPTMTVVFFSVNAALQAMLLALFYASKTGSKRRQLGENGEEIIARLKRDLLPTMMNGVMYWPICDFVTYKFIPVNLQPLVSNSFSYLWTVYITYMASLEKASTIG